MSPEDIPEQRNPLYDDLWLQRESQGDAELMDALVEREQYFIETSQIRGEGGQITEEQFERGREVGRRIRARKEALGIDPFSDG